MTWICAASTVYGYGVLYSDVQVTFRSTHKTEDLIQKAYPISNFLAAGFSGSVRIGFGLVNSLQDSLRMPADARETQAWEPKWVSEKWAPSAKSLFDHAPRVERDVKGTGILLVGVSPTETCGLGAKVYITRFCAPDFRPQIMSRPVQSFSIGSGAKVAEYKRRVKPLLRLTSGIMQAEVMNPGGWARQLGFSISRALADHPRDGISKHLHYVIIQRGSIAVETNDENIYPREGPAIEIRMPVVAQSYEQFQQLAKSFGHEAAGAAC
jgi:hypothetical protein